MNVYWLEQSDGEAPGGEQWLSARERAHLHSLRIPKRRADWRLGRWTAKSAVRAYLDLPHDPESLAAIELRPAPSGAPEVFLHGSPGPLVLSLSHSSGTGFCAVAPPGVELGCDLEAVEPRSPAFLADFFTGEEQALLALTRESARDRLLTLLWSAKESALKALRLGLRADTRSVTAAPTGPFLSAGEWRALSAANVGGRVFRGWWRESSNRVWTVLADPPPLSLIALHV